MRVIGIRSVPVSSLYLDGAFGTRLDEPRIKERAKSIQENGLLVEPLVRESDMRVIDGRDRIAAVLQLGHETIDVKLVECTDEECDILERVTTIERRHDSEEQRRALEELVDLYQKRLEPDHGPRKPGRQKASRTKARERVAVETGVKADTLRKREERAKKKNPPPDILPTEPPIRTIGIALNESWLDQIHEVQEKIDDAASYLSRAQATLTSLERSGLPFPPALQRLKEQIHECAKAVRGARPESLCPHCKGLEGVQEICLCCAKLGYITDSQLERIPKQFWDEEAPVVTVAGRTIKMSEVRAANDTAEAWGIP